MSIPNLEPVDRNREYNACSDEQRDKIVYYYTFFNDYTHRKLDEILLGLDLEYSRGYQSMNVLHHLGLKGKHKGIFYGMEVQTAIDLMRMQDENHFSQIIKSLERVDISQISQKVFSSWEILDEKIALKTVDRSVFVYNGSAIPNELKKHFNLEILKLGEKRPISLLYHGEYYKAYFRLDERKSPQTRLF